MLLIRTEEGSLTQFSSVLQLSFHICWTLSLSVPPPLRLCLSECMLYECVLSTLSPQMPHLDERWEKPY